jgi:hypothetical protein
MVLRGASVHLGVKPQVRERALIRVLIIAVRVLIIAVRVLIIAIRVPILALSRRYVSERCRFLIDPEQFTIVECNLDGIGTPECDERQHSTPGPALPALHQPTGR